MDLSTITLSQVISTIRDAGAIGILVLILVGGYKKWWVWGHLYEASQRERDEWRDIALRGTELADRIVEITKKGHRDA